MSKTSTGNDTHKHLSKQNVSAILLKTSDGRFVGSKDTDDAPVVASAKATDLFELVELESGKVALKAASSGKYVSANPETGLAANQSEIGLTETFTPIRNKDGKLALQLSDNIHYISAKRGEGKALTANAVKAGVREGFIFEQINLNIPDDTEGVAPKHDCCGPSADTVTNPSSTAVDLMWDDETHSQLVELAIHLLRPGLTVEAREFINWWDTRGHYWHFQQNVKKGLRDADYESPWHGSEIDFWFIGKIRMYETHFYDPDTKLNYMNKNNTAVKVGNDCFYESVNFAKTIIRHGNNAPPELYARAGYYLGLSLHFLTDLTQPMHASNFGNIFGSNYPLADQYIAPNILDRRHSGFEAYADAKVKAGYFNNYPALVERDLGLDDIQNATWFLHHTAVNQKRVFTKYHLDTILRHKYLGDSGFPAYIPIWNNYSWGGEADPALEASLKLAPKAVARYIAYWTRCAMKDA